MLIFNTGATKLKKNTGLMCHSFFTVCKVRKYNTERIFVLNGCIFRLGNLSVVFKCYGNRYGFARDIKESEWGKANPFILTVCFNFKIILKSDMTMNEGLHLTENLKRIIVDLRV
jgi:hypothetical protein